MLRLLGHDVCIAYDGAEAVALAESFRPQLALLDIGMPRLNGYEAARAIKAQPSLRAVLLVALSGWGQAEDKRRSRDAGFQHHFVKPVDPAMLTRLLA
jgi:CheY-like chemotaxis protein